jgi:hypothetical protein
LLGISDSNPANWLLAAAIDHSSGECTHSKARQDETRGDTDTDALAGANAKIEEWLKS